MVSGNAWSAPEVALRLTPEESGATMWSPAGAFGPTSFTRAPGARVMVIVAPFLVTTRVNALEPVFWMNMLLPVTVTVYVVPAELTLWMVTPAKEVAKGPEVPETEEAPPARNGLDQLRL